MPKTILHIIDSLETGGAEVLFAGTVPLLKNYKNIVVTLKPNNDFEEALNGLDYYCLHYDNKLDLIRSVRQLQKIIYTHRVDLIHSHLLTSSFLARIAKKNVPLVFSVHNLLSESAFKNSILSKVIEKATYKKNQQAIFVSNSIKKDYDLHVGLKGRYHILPNYVEHKFFENGSKYKPKIEKPFRLVSVGTLKEQKNFAYLIESLVHIEGCTLDIIGDGPLMDDLVQKILHYGLKDRVRLIGKRTDIVNQLSKYDLFVLASKYEGFGISALEAMAFGLPTMLSDIDVFREVAADASIFFDLNDVNDFIYKLKDLKSSNKKLALLSKKGSNRASEISSKEIYLNKLHKIYNETCLSKAR